MLGVSSGLNMYGTQRKMLYYKDNYIDGFFFPLKGKYCDEYHLQQAKSMSKNNLFVLYQTTILVKA